MSTSRSLNKVTLIGNLTRNPVIRTVGGGSVVCNFGLATNATWRDSSGNIQERTEFHNLVAWNKLAEICAQILATGMLVYIEGELRTRTWDDSSGNRHYKTEIKIDDMKLLDDKGKKGVGIDEAKKLADSEDGSSSSTVTESVAPSTATAVSSDDTSDDSDDEYDESEADDLF